MPKTEKPSTLLFVHSFRSDHSNAIKNNDKAIHSKKFEIVISSLATESDLIYLGSELYFDFGDTHNQTLHNIHGKDSCLNRAKSFNIPKIKYDFITIFEWWKL